MHTIDKRSDLVLVRSKRKTLHRTFDGKHNRTKLKTVAAKMNTMYRFVSVLFFLHEAHSLKRIVYQAKKKKPKNERVCYSYVISYARHAPAKYIKPKELTDYSSNLETNVQGNVKEKKVTSQSMRNNNNKMSIPFNNQR